MNEHDTEPPTAQPAEVSTDPAQLIPEGQRGVILPALSYEAYDRIDAIRHSLLAEMDVPARARQKMLEPHEPSRSLVLGQAGHTLFLEPDRFYQRFLPCTEKLDRRTKADKQKWQALEETAKREGKELLTFDEWQTVIHAHKSLSRVNDQDSPDAARVLQAPNRAAELTLVWKDKAPRHDGTSRYCKCRFDIVCVGTEGYIGADLKFTDNITADEFTRSVFRYQYDTQAAFYADGWEAATGSPLQLFVFLPIAKDGTSVAGFYSMTPEAMTVARAINEERMRALNWCQARDRWPGVDPDVISPPRWRAPIRRAYMEGAESE